MNRKDPWFRGVTCLAPPDVFAHIKPHKLVNKLSSAIQPPPQMFYDRVLQLRNVNNDGQIVQQKSRSDRPSTESGPIARGPC